MEKRIKYLESKLTEGLEDKYRDHFEKTARYMGNGVYSYAGQLGTDTREVFLMGILGMEGIQFEKV